MKWYSVTALAALLQQSASGVKIVNRFPIQETSNQVQLAQLNAESQATGICDFISDVKNEICSAFGCENEEDKKCKEVEEKNCEERKALKECKLNAVKAKVAAKQADQECKKADVKAKVAAKKEENESKQEEVKEKVAAKKEDKCEIVEEPHVCEVAQPVCEEPEPEVATPV